MSEVSFMCSGEFSLTDLMESYEEFQRGRLAHFIPVLEEVASRAKSEYRLMFQQEILDSWNPVDWEANRMQTHPPSQPESTQRKAAGFAMLSRKKDPEASLRRFLIGAQPRGGVLLAT